MCCKSCASKERVKNGKVRGKQRWKCLTCGYNYTEGDRRKEWRTEKHPFLPTFSILLVGLGLSFRLTAKILGLSHVSVQRWFDSFTNHLEIKVPKPEEVQVIELDEMWHFIQKKRTNAGFGKHLGKALQVKHNCSTWLLVGVIEKPVDS